MSDPVTMETLAEWCSNMERIANRASDAIDMLSSENAALKSVLAAARERIDAEAKERDLVVRYFAELDALLVAARASIPEIDQWTISAPLIRLRQLLSVEAPRPKSAVGPRLVTPEDLQ